MDLIAYVQGPYGRVEDERTDRDLEVEGELPADLAGVFVQNHANPRFEPMGFYHWFDGDGMVHGVEIAGGKATYRNRYIRTAAFEAESAAGKVLAPGILGPLGPLDGAAPLDKDTANTDVTFFQGGLFATWWLSGEPMRLSLPDLDTVGVERFGAPPGLRVAAHPKVDPRRGELVFIDYDVYGRRPLRTGVIGADGRLLRLHEVPGARPTLYHDIAITEHHTVIPDLPMAYNPAKLAQGKRRPEFLRDAPARFAVVHRDTGAVRWFEASPCYSYHTVNAWEETDARGSRIHLIGCRIEQPVPLRPRAEDADVPRLFHLRLEPVLYRWTFDLGTGDVREEALDDTLTEFPRMDDRWLGARSRFAFHPRVDRGMTLLFDGLIRYDLEAGTSKTLALAPDKVGAEAVFAPRGAGEGDGWLIHFQTDRQGERSELVVIDAVEMTPVARVKLPRRVPFAFHAEWAPLTA
jgi:carotenoid cleavage dioxygenase